MISSSASLQTPSSFQMSMMPNCQKIEITKTYLKSDNGNERLIRARGMDDDYLYYLTEKRKISNIKRVETEKKLTQDEYLKLLMEADNNLHTIRKTRYYLTENNQYFEIDIYPEWQNQAIMEIELNNENQEINLPNFINIVKEVTNDEQYKNYNMAKYMPKELVKKKTIKR